MATRIGIDLASIATVADALEQHGERYFRRVFTDQEVAACRDARGRLDASRLAARFAAKEATLKVLRLDDVGVALTSIEIVSRSGGAVDLALSGNAAELARECRLTDFSVSLTHEHEYAAAVVVAQVGMTGEM